MARKYDRYGYNRQFKAKPCSKLYPFPYPLPFVDDYSVANGVEKVDANPGSTPGDPDSHINFPNFSGQGGVKKKPTRDEIEEVQRIKRAKNVARKLAFEHPMSEWKKAKLSRRERRMNAAFYFVAGSILTGGVAGELDLLRPAARGIRRAARIVRKARYVVERWNRRNFGAGRYHID